MSHKVESMCPVGLFGGQKQGRPCLGQRPSKSSYSSPLPSTCGQTGPFLRVMEETPSLAVSNQAALAQMLAAMTRGGHP